MAPTQFGRAAEEPLDVQADQSNPDDRTTPDLAEDARENELIETDEPDE